MKNVPIRAIILSGLFASGTVYSATGLAKVAANGSWAPVTTGGESVGALGLNSGVTRYAKPAVRTIPSGIGYEVRLGAPFATVNTRYNDVRATKGAVGAKVVKN